MARDTTRPGAVTGTPAGRHPRQPGSDDASGTPAEAAARWRQWGWFAALYLASLAALFVVVSLVRLLLPVPG